MRSGLIQRTFLLSSLVIGGAALAYGCTLDSEGQLAPDASLDGSGGGTGGTGGTTGDSGLDQETPDIGSPDVPCFYPDKICDGVCVNFDDPDYGCAQDTCDPCPTYTNSTATCSNNKCLPKCNEGWQSCDSDPENGCETDIHSVDNCGDCGVQCTLANAIEQCDEGICGIQVCEDLFGDCNDNEYDGCETNLRDVENCGSCGELCDVVDPTCASGECFIDNCPDGTANCNGDQATCETDITTISDCGSCSTNCTGSNVESWSCDEVSGSRTCVVVACVADWLNCDGNDATGCEVDRLKSVNDCGQCGGVCSGQNAESRACINGQCDPVCNSGYADCDGPEPGVSDDGCETVVSSDVNNCGSCGNKCVIDHAVENCQSGNCGIQSCDSGWGNCDGNVQNGCETNLHTLTNCGKCGEACDIPNSGEQCDTGVCTATGCASGWGDCTSAAGCETPLNTLTNCGGCGTACNLPNATESCSTGTCQLVSCDTGWGDCTGALGCETPLNTLTNCGDCGVTCSFLNAAESCSTGTCVMGACDTNYGDCTSSQGCETPLTTTTNCGGCGVTCSFLNAAESCSTGTCVMGACDTNYGDCTSSQGCETPLTTTTNCGGCAVACNFANASESCSTGTCTFTSCQPGYADCSGDAGCETSTSSDINNCGGCGQICSSDHITSVSCSSGLCGGTCTDGYEDCNGNKLTDGCETDINSPTSCGGCSSCTTLQGLPPTNASWTCPSGSCVAECDSGWTDCDGTVSGCECPGTFVCTGGNICKCDSDADCGPTGVATCNNGSGLCSCTDGGSVTTECAATQICSASGTCQ